MNNNSNNKTKVKSDRFAWLLKLPIFIVARNNGVEFCQKSIGSIRCSVFKSYDNAQCGVTIVPSVVGDVQTHFSDKFNNNN